MWSNLFCTPATTDCSVGEASSAALALVCTVTLHTTVSSPSTSVQWSVEVSSHSSLCVRVHSRTSVLPATTRAMHTNVHAFTRPVTLCTCVCVHCGAPLFARKGNTDCSAGEAGRRRTSPSHRANVSRAASVPPAHPPTCPGWVGRPWAPKAAHFSVLINRDTQGGRAPNCEPPRVTGENKQMHLILKIKKPQARAPKRPARNQRHPLTARSLSSRSKLNAGTREAGE